MDNNKTNDKNMKILITMMSLILAFLAGFISVVNFPKSLEYMAKDGLYQNPGVIPDYIKIIAIDEETLLKLGPYSSWDRSYFAELIQILNTDKETAPSVIGIDVIFSGTNDSAEDEMLVVACEEAGNVVVAATITFDSQLYQDVDGKYYTVQRISDAGKPYDKLDEVVDHGFTNALFDEDGFVRRTHSRLEYKYDDRVEVYDSFAYKIASRVGDVKDYPAQIEIALVSNPGEFEKISMADILEGKIPAGYFDDCIVLVGTYEEGLMDSYRVPIDHSKEMYGVELQANYVYGLLNDRIICSVNEILQFFITFFIVFFFSFWANRARLRNSMIGMVLIILGYILIAYLLFQATFYELNLLAIPIGVVLAFLVAVIYKYIEMQRKRLYEMQGMLFSMAEAMAETIEGRTPYNASHTKNVARRCMEMLDYINLQHQLKRTKLHFTEDDKRQLYLAAMLHDVGKMDIPLEVMDKSSKLGSRETALRARLEIISLRIENDVLNGYLESKEAGDKLEQIKLFIDSLGAFNCGRPLNEEEWKLVDEIAESTYVDRDGKAIPYLTEEEIDDLRIKVGTLSEKERTIMQSHVTYTDKILAHIKFGDHFGKVRVMASNHHELLNGKGYPKGLKEEDLDAMTRILTIMDIYDSLIADDRPYKKSKSVKEAFEILDEEALAGKIDKELLVFAKELYLVEETSNTNKML